MSSNVINGSTDISAGLIPESYLQSRVAQQDNFLPKKPFDKFVPTMGIPGGGIRINPQGMGLPILPLPTRP